LIKLILYEKLKNGRRKLPKRKGLPAISLWRAFPAIVFPRFFDIGYCDIGYCDIGYCDIGYFLLCILL